MCWVGNGCCTSRIEAFELTFGIHRSRYNIPRSFFVCLYFSWLQIDDKKDVYGDSKLIDYENLSTQHRQLFGFFESCFSQSIHWLLTSSLMIILWSVHVSIGTWAVVVASLWWVIDHSGRIVLRSRVTGMHVWQVASFNFWESEVITVKVLIQRILWVCVTYRGLMHMEMTRAPCIWGFLY